MQQKEQAQLFASLHVKGRPLILYNAWDAGSANAITRAGAQAIGTSSWAIAAAHGYEDGESLPLSLAEQLIGCITRSATVPVTVDAEGGYSDVPQACAENIARLIDLGVVGINFEDRIVAGTGLHGIEAHCARIAAIRSIADARGIPLFINARTDLFFGTGIVPENGLDEARKRAQAYAKAGASGLFVPGLIDLRVITELASMSDLPLNLMVMPGLPDMAALSSAGVARISYGPAAYLHAMKATGEAAQGVLA